LSDIYSIHALSRTQALINRRPKCSKFGGSFLGTKELTGSLPAPSFPGQPGGSCQPLNPALGPGAENLHFTLNGEPRRAPGPPVAGAHTAWEDADQVSFAVPR
jgi:hypothetical protein